MSPPILTLNPDSHQLTWYGHPVQLSPMCFRWLHELARLPGCAVSHRQLLRVSHHDGLLPDRYSNNLRDRVQTRVLAQAPVPLPIRSTEGYGYSLDLFAEQILISAQLIPNDRPQRTVG